MPNRQYIGARYVPKFFNNGGSNDWVSGIAYEPLTIVTYLNNSYTSVKPVPSNAGAPNVATEYWACTGDYSSIVSQLTGEVEDLSTAVSGLSGEVTGVKNRATALETYNQYLPTKVLCIGDSYGMKIINNWCNYLKAYMGLDADHFTNKCTGSSGFIGNTGVKTFYQQLTEPEDKDTYTHIIIVGGFNDAYDSEGNIQSNANMLTAINQCGTYIKANYPNAKVFLGCPAMACNLGNPNRAAVMRTQISQMRNVYSFYGTQQGWAYMSALDYVLHDTAYFNTSDVTYECVFHPNGDGGQNICRAILSYINGGELQINRAPSCTVAPEDGITITGTFHEKQVNDKFAIYTNGNTTITFGTPLTFAQSTNIVTLSSNFEHKIVYPKNDLTLNISAKVRTIYSDSSSSYGVATLAFDGNSLKLWCPPYTDEDKSISQIVFFPFKIDTDIMFN